MPGQAVITIRDKQWQVSLAGTPWELAQGLGGLPELAPDSGMLFDTGWEQIIQVTTVPMLFPIDIAFFSESLVVTEVYRNVEPGFIVTSNLPARYFLEVNTGELEGIEAGDSALVELLSMAETPPVASDWTSTMMSFFGFVVMGAFMVAIVKGFVKDTLESEKKPVLYGPRGEKLLPQTRKHKPNRSDVSVDSWQERDRLGIWITDRRTDKVIAEWWDDDARQMFEDGFFKPGKQLKESVLDYAESIGLLAGGKYLAQTVREAYYWTAVNKDTGEIAENYTPYTSPGRALVGGRAFVSRHWRGVALVEVWKQPGRYSEGLKIEPVSSARVTLGKSTAVITAEEKPPGTCYADAWRFLIKEEEGELIHGTVFSGGHRIGHAWVETATGYVWEPETGRYFTLLGFKEAFAPVIENRYTAEQAAIMAARTRNFGPWTEQERRQYLKEKSPAVIPAEPRRRRPKTDELEFLSDSPEFLAYTIEDIGYRDKLDNAFHQAIRRAKGPRRSGS